MRAMSALLTDVLALRPSNRATINAKPIDAMRFTMLPPR
jgi:hypothetical protein